MTCRALQAGILIGLALGGQGCVLKREPTPEDLRTRALPNVAVPNAWSAADTSTETIEHGWLAGFADRQLDVLVSEALQYNADLSAAAARVERAAAHVRVARGELYPAVNALGVSGQESGDASGLQGVVVSAAWELDLWGRVRYGTRASGEQHFAAQVDYLFARQSLAALVAKSWFMAIESALQQHLADQMVEAAAQLVRLAEEREKVGVGSALDVATARVSLATYQDSALQLDLAREQALRALELLLGRYPAGELAVAESLPALGPPTPAGLPSQLLERRPDVIAAEQRVRAAFNLMQQARAARLPTLSITGSGTDLTSDLFVLQERENPVWGIGGRVLAPLFSGGALKAQVAVRTAEQKEAIAAYAAIALKAFADVENALSSELAMHKRESVLTASVTDAAHALKLAETRYRVGSTDLRTVEQQQLAYHSAVTSLLRVQSEQRVQRVNLHLALGGDF